MSNQARTPDGKYTFTPGTNAASGVRLGQKLRTIDDEQHDDELSLLSRQNQEKEAIEEVHRRRSALVKLFDEEDVKKGGVGAFYVSDLDSNRYPTTLVFRYHNSDMSKKGDFVYDPADGSVTSHHRSGSLREKRVLKVIGTPEFRQHAQSYINAVEEQVSIGNEIRAQRTYLYEKYSVNQTDTALRSNHGDSDSSRQSWPETAQERAELFGYTLTEVTEQRELSLIFDEGDKVAVPTGLPPALSSAVAREALGSEVDYVGMNTSGMPIYRRA